MKSIIVVTVLSALTLANAAESVQDKTVIVSSQDREMLQAIEKAKSTLDEFLKLKRNPPNGATQFKLKVLISDAYGREHMWVSPFKQTATGFSGTLADEPEYVRNVTNGQELTFLRKDISDWGYVQDGKQKGSFTVCVLFKRMPIAEVQKYRDAYGFEC